MAEVTAKQTVGFEIKREITPRLFEWEAKTKLLNPTERKRMQDIRYQLHELASSLMNSDEASAEQAERDREARRRP